MILLRLISWPYFRKHILRTLLTVADVAVYGDVSYAGEAAIDLAPYPNVKAWMERIEKLPGFKKYEDVLPKQDAA